MTVVRLDFVGVATISTSTCRGSCAGDVIRSLHDRSAIDFKGVFHSCHANYKTNCEVSAFSDEESYISTCV